tara:strand:+ start:492 stop:635 length:144 start_codon:yes stop_codon:yes gene_type:complete
MTQLDKRLKHARVVARQKNKKAVAAVKAVRKARKNVLKLVKEKRKHH